jgi:N-glycosylase/DNA lyase
MEIEITDDFDLDKIARSGQCFRMAALADGTYRIIHTRHVLYVKQVGKQLWDFDCSPAAYASVWRPFFDLDRRYKRIRRQIPREDAYLKKASVYGRGIRILRQDPWETLAAFIISQRKNIPAICKAVEDLSRQFGEVIATPREQVYAFPAPAALAEAGETALRQLGLGYRAPYVWGSARMVARGEVDLAALADAEDAELFDALKTLPGVGDKIANCVMLFGFGRLGRFPVDVWIKRVLDTAYGGDEGYRGYGPADGVMQQYMFFYARDHGH